MKYRNKSISRIFFLHIFHEGEEVELFPTWRDVDDRFFFNRTMVEELIELGDQRLDAWITPFIQGYVEIRECTLDFQEAESYYDETNPETATSTKLPDFYTIALISRRSRYRAGRRPIVTGTFFGLF